MHESSLSSCCDRDNTQVSADENEPQKPIALLILSMTGYDVRVHHVVRHTPIIFFNFINTRIVRERNFMSDVRQLRSDCQPGQLYRHRKSSNSFH